MAIIPHSPSDKMHDHALDFWIHPPLAALWLSMAWWLDIDHVSHVVMFLIGLTLGCLQIAYWVRKHHHFKK